MPFSRFWVGVLNNNNKKDRRGVSRCGSWRTKFLAAIQLRVCSVEGTVEDSYAYPKEAPAGRFTVFLGYGDYGVQLFFRFHNGVGLIVGTKDSSTPGGVATYKETPLS